MRQLPVRASALVFSSAPCHRRRGCVLFDLSGDGPVRKYHPEEHYMRGPGPKWREKHLHDRASVGGT